MKGGRPKWHFVGIADVDGLDDGAVFALDADALDVDADSHAGDGLGALVTECNFC